MSKLGKPRQNKIRPLTTAEAMELACGRGRAVKADHNEVDGIVLFFEGERVTALQPYLEGEYKEKLLAYWKGEAMTVRGFRLTDEQWKFCSRQYGGAGAFVRKVLDQMMHGHAIADADERRRQEQAGVGARPFSGDTSNNVNDKEVG